MSDQEEGGKKGSKKKDKKGFIASIFTFFYGRDRSPLLVDLLVLIYKSRRLRAAAERDIKELDSLIASMESSRNKELSENVLKRNSRMFYEDTEEVNERKATKEELRRVRV